MAGSTFGLEPDPRLVGGDAALIAPAVGEDELEMVRAPSGAGIIVEDTSPSATRVLLADLVDFNRSFSSVAPVIRVPTQVRLIDEVTEKPLPGLFHLDTEITPPFTRSLFTLRRIVVRRPPEEVRAEAATRKLDELQSTLDSEDEDALDFFLETMLHERESALADLRLVAEIHRDSVQNAVDIVQTKRIDFLENPVETGIEGTFLGFVIGEIAAAAIPSVIGLVFETVAKGAFSLAGAAAFHQSKLELSAFVAGRQQSLEGNIMLLRAAKGLRFPQGSPLIKEKNRLLNRLRQEIKEQKKDIAKAGLEQRLLFQAILPDAMARAKIMRARLSPPAPGAPRDPVHHGGNVAKAVLTKRIMDSFRLPSRAKTDPGLKLSAIPVDVAMKLEVQTYFDPWLAAAETGVGFVRMALATLRRFGTLPDTAVTELAALVAFSADLEEATEGMRAFVVNSAAARADVMSFYELLLWLTLYRPRLSHVPELRRTRIETDANGNVKGPIKQLPIADKGTMNLLRYLAQRFFGKGKVVGEGADAELVLTNDELLGVYIQLERLCADVFQPVKGGGGDLLASALKDIRFSLIKYE